MLLEERSDEDLSGQGRSWRERLAAPVGTLIVVLALMAAFVAFFIYEIPCWEDCSNRTPIFTTELVVGLGALLPVAIAVLGLVKGKKLLMAIGILAAIAAYATWGIVIGQAAHAG
jgi:hypothetical protein